MKTKSQLLQFDFKVTIIKIANWDGLIEEHLDPTDKCVK